MWVSLHDSPFLFNNKNECKKSAREIASRPRESFYDPLVHWESGKHLSLFRNVSTTRWVNKQTHIDNYNGVRGSLLPAILAGHFSSLVFFITFANYSTRALWIAIYLERDLTRKSESNKTLRNPFCRIGSGNLARLLNNSEITQPLNLIWLHSSYSFTSSSNFPLRFL